MIAGLRGLALGRKKGLWDVAYLKKLGAEPCSDGRSFVT